MRVTAILDAPVEPGVLFAAVAELDRYPAWLDIVPRAERTEAVPGDAGAAWSVDLRGRVGPLARSKRLRMVRVDQVAGSHVRFQRREVDGRQHSAWVLTASVEATEAGSRLTMELHYGGNLFGPVLERILVDEIERSRPRLLALLAS